MRVLYLTLDSIGGFGGISQYCTDVAVALNEHPEHESTTIFALQAQTPNARLPRRTRFFCAEGSKPRYVLHLLRFLSHNPAPQVILCGHINLLPLAILARQITQAPIALFIYGIDAWEPMRLWHRWMVNRTTAIISISEVTLNRFREWAPIGDVPSFIFPNAVDLQRFTPGPKDPELLSRFNLTGRKVLLTFGRLVSKERYKGFDEVLNILPKLRKAFPSMVYVIAGTGDDKQRLQGRVKNEGLEDAVVFTGYVDEAQKIDLYRCADVYVMPSRGEGFGFVLIEAAACGIKVIGSKLDGTREALLGGKLGPLVSPDSPEELETAIISLLNSSSEYPYGRPATQRLALKECFSYETFSARVAGILTNCLQHSPINKI